MLLGATCCQWECCSGLFVNKLLTYLDSTGVPVLLMNTALFWEMTPF